MLKNKVILLISGNQLKVPYPVYPIGLSYIATYLRKQAPEYKVLIFDFNLQSFADLEIILKEETPSVVGISLRNIDNVNVYDTQNFIQYYQSIIQHIRKSSSAKIVMGGAGYSIFPEKLFEFLKPDFGIMGEGEEALLKLLTSMDSANGYEEIEGLVYLSPEGIKANKRTSYAKNLQLEFEPQLLDYYWQNGGMLNVQTKRGCPYSCDYCSYPLIEGKLTRNLDAESVIENLKKMKINHGVNYVFFTDSVFNISNRYNIDLAEKIIQSGLKINWGAYFTPFNLSKEHLKLFKASGLTHIEFGTDSISEKMLENFNKKFTVEDIINASLNCQQMEIFFAHFLILGGYKETKETIHETMENSKKIPPTVFFPTMGVRIYPGTILCKRAISEGLINNNDELMDSVYYISDQVNPEAIKQAAQLTGRKWIFMDEDLGPGMKRMRARGKKGPLWEYLIQ
jgi:radical SAM superfamily enzyme YgiQ (UPF0313 family)